jgi:hypothetical protein
MAKLSGPAPHLTPKPTRPVRTGRGTGTAFGAQADTAGQNRTPIEDRGCLTRAIPFESLRLTISAESRDGWKPVCTKFGP